LEFGGLFVMFTYILAQYFIATGLLKALNSEYPK